MAQTSSNSTTWVGNSISELCSNKGHWSFNVNPVNISKYHTVLYKLPVTFKDLPEPHENSDPKHWDEDHVRMPYSDKSFFPSHENGIDVIKLRWKFIKESLSKPINNSKELEAAISSYNSSLPKLSALHRYFDELDDDENEQFFGNLLPKIIKLALKLPQIVPGSIPLLKKNWNHTVSLSQQQIASLLANAFLCTFPWRKSIACTYPGVNFVGLFIADKRPKRLHCTFEKLKCIFHYFHVVTKVMPTGVVTFERKFINKSNIPRWDTLDIDFKDTKVHIDSSGTIEDNGLGFLQVDFANKNVGGGVLGYGCVQEEIRFVICPELIVSRLFVEQLSDLEAVTVTGVERFSKYSGYGDTFSWEGSFHDETPRDEYGRKRTTICIIDATSYHKSSQQFHPSAMLREINKAYVGFSLRNKINVSPVATGNWGCGTFQGNPYLKALLQLMACNATGRHMVYYTFGNAEFRDDFYKMYLFLINKCIKVNQLWKCLCGFSLQHYEIDLYSYIQKAFSDSKKQPTINAFFKKYDDKLSVVHVKKMANNGAGTSNSIENKIFYGHEKSTISTKTNNVSMKSDKNLEDDVVPCSPEESPAMTKKIRTKKSNEEIEPKLPTTDIGLLIDEMDGGHIMKDAVEDSFLVHIDRLSRESRNYSNSSQNDEMDVDISEDIPIEAKSKRKISDYFQKASQLS